MSLTMQNRYDYKSNSLVYEYKFTPTAPDRTPLHGVPTTESTPLTAEEQERQDREIEHCCRPVSKVCKNIFFSKCEMIGVSLGTVMTFTGAGLSAVDDTAAMAVAYPGIALLVGMCVKRIFINIYYCATGCPEVQRDANVQYDNTCKEWCLCGRATPFCNC